MHGRIWSAAVIRRLPDSSRGCSGTDPSKIHGRAAPAAFLIEGASAWFDERGDVGDGVVDDEITAVAGDVGLVEVHRRRWVDGHQRQVGAVPAFARMSVDGHPASASTSSA